MRQITDTISTYDTETGTTQHETTITFYTLDELSNDARARALHDWMDNRESDPCWFNDCYESEIWECVRDLEKNIAGARVSWSYNPWYSCDFDCIYKINDIDWISPDEMEPAKDCGICYSMDLCDAWNKHARRLNAIARAYDCMVDIQLNKYPANEWEYNGKEYGEEHNRAFYNRLEDMTAKLHDCWIIELEAACDDVRNEIETLLRGEWDYFTSEEYACMEFEDESTQGGEWHTIDNTGRVYYSDNRLWYTIDGERVDLDGLNHECVSLARVS